MADLGVSCVQTSKNIFLFSKKKEYLPQDSFVIFAAFTSISIVLILFPILLSVGALSIKMHAMFYNGLAFEFETCKKKNLKSKFETQEFQLHIII